VRGGESTQPRRKSRINENNKTLVKTRDNVWGWKEEFFFRKFLKASVLLTNSIKNLNGV